jgi:tRNA modification GTPase
MNLPTADQTIIAQCTPQGSGALALIRLSGEHAVEIATAISSLASGKKLIEQPTHTIHYGSVIDGTTVIDNVMFILMKAPRTFTGEDTVEITCHNNLFITEVIIELAIRHGARLAQQGEFTRRAVLNNKMDLLQAEALKELIHANTQMALKKSLAQLDGTFSQWMNTLETDLLGTLALSDASFEFIDEEMSFAPQIKDRLSSVRANINEIKKTFNNQHHIRQGIRIAIVGSVNAGKSSLFNQLINYNRAIVTPIPGTTRDSLEAGVYRHGTYITFIDTAGLRQTNDIIEQEGILRAHAEAAKADIILLTIDSSRHMTEQEQHEYAALINEYGSKIIVVLNKSDKALPGFSYDFSPSITNSTLSKHDFEKLEQIIAHTIQQLFNQIESPYLLNQRQHTLLLALEQKLAHIASMLNGSINYELVSYELKEALAHVSELTGRTISEKGMDAVFRDFCVGK